MATAPPLLGYGDTRLSKEASSDHQARKSPALATATSTELSWQFPHAARR